MEFEEKKEPTKKDPSSLPDGKTEQQKADLMRIMELGRKFYAELKAKGPNYDRLGQSFVQVKRRK
jgi:hypothetical protein